MSSLNKYTGPWNDHLAAHLLRRTTYGVPYTTIKDFGKKTMNQCVDTILETIPAPAPPINYTYATDPDVQIGQTWVDKGRASNLVDGYRQQSLRVWTYELLTAGIPNIREKMTMFWHNHFVTADINDPRMSYMYINLLRKSALGNFKQLTKDITIDAAMLNYLNGRDNTGQAPNENYARELMELFTLGKGDDAGPGDYTTYTETDVKELARALSGWIDVRNTTAIIKTEYRAGRHDTRAKTLSHRFNNEVINNAGADEYKNVVDIIFKKPEVAIFMATKLYRWFVKSGIEEDIKKNVIIPLADIIRSNNYEIGPAVKALISSQHFYDECVIGAIIKNPVDFIINPINQMQVALPTTDALKVTVFQGINRAFVTPMEMAIFEAPSVAGWPQYYQEPGFSRLWLNASSLPTRKRYSDAIASVGISYQQGSYRFQIDTLKTVNQFTKPDDVDHVLAELSLILLVNPLAANQLTLLKGILNTGNTGDWTKAYTTYKSNPSNQTNLTIINTRLRNLVVYMMRMPEYHLS
jgi:hypothetical protein